MITHLRKIWNEPRSKSKQLLHGHLFRIGVASLRWNVGASREDIKECGRWRSAAYLIYLRRFTDKEMEKVRKLLKELRWKPLSSLEARVEWVKRTDEEWNGKQDPEG